LRTVKTKENGKRGEINGGTNIDLLNRVAGTGKQSKRSYPSAWPNATITSLDKTENKRLECRRSNTQASKKKKEHVAGKRGGPQVVGISPNVKKIRGGCRIRRPGEKIKTREGPRGYKGEAGWDKEAICEEVKGGIYDVLESMSPIGRPARKVQR